MACFSGHLTRFSAVPMQQQRARVLLLKLLARLLWTQVRQVTPAHLHWTVHDLHQCIIQLMASANPDVKELHRSRVLAMSHCLQRTLLP